tara:strand:- start:280 stop:384 length:105 start_codon:yes stop_codon:yes gene_type:complete
VINTTTKAISTNTGVGGGALDNYGVMTLKLLQYL